MTRITYVQKNFKEKSLETIREANSIVREYTKAGYQLTLRQLYYQFVARGLIENTSKSYDNLGSLINDARLAGLMDWESIDDRLRQLVKLSSWETPADIMDSTAESFHLDRWADQKYRLEVWVEKDALADVVEQVCTRWDVPHFACRGYSSQSAQWRAGMRLAQHILHDDKEVIVLHLGDHDPSGIDMTRDNEDRLRMFMGEDASPHFELIRIALNMDQVEEYNPPPNPAKLSDSRAEGYIALHGDESWELDALEPRVLDNLIETHIEKYVDANLFAARGKEEDKGKKMIANAAHDVRYRQDNPEEFPNEEDES